ncbi:hypothetical protein NPIL_229701 [Nephila pilipes]|uniref:Uncharacterized protein n=1 Tax=Nephila pilipes TaxID=299642 RepID=A0A8X6QS55_NEPPI|nr:hypothetical protein NPIL_229701 [Nephila pilipes]
MTITYKNSRVKSAIRFFNIFKIIKYEFGLTFKPVVTDTIHDKPPIPCKQSDENSAANDSNFLTYDKPAVTRHGRQIKKPARSQD